MQHTVGERGSDVRYTVKQFSQTRTTKLFRFGLGEGGSDFRQLLRRVAGPAWTHVNFEPHDPVLKGSFTVYQAISRSALKCR
jgi:hypothetical protein